MKKLFFILTLISCLCTGSRLMAMMRMQEGKTVAEQIFEFNKEKEIFELSEPAINRFIEKLDDINKHRLAGILFLRQNIVLCLLSEKCATVSRNDVPELFDVSLEKLLKKESEICAALSQDAQKILQAIDIINETIEPDFTFKQFAHYMFARKKYAQVANFIALNGNDTYEKNYIQPLKALATLLSKISQDNTKALLKEIECSEKPGKKVAFQKKTTQKKTCKKIEGTPFIDVQEIAKIESILKKFLTLKFDCIDHLTGGKQKKVTISGLLTALGKAQNLDAISFLDPEILDHNQAGRRRFIDPSSLWITLKEPLAELKKAICVYQNKIEKKITLEIRALINLLQNLINNAEQFLFLDKEILLFKEIVKKESFFETYENASNFRFLYSFFYKKIKKKTPKDFCSIVFSPDDKKNLPDRIFVLDSLLDAQDDQLISICPSICMILEKCAQIDFVQAFKTDEENLEEKIQDARLRYKRINDLDRGAFTTITYPHLNIVKLFCEYVSNIDLIVKIDTKEIRIFEPWFAFLSNINVQQTYRLHFSETIKYYANQFKKKSLEKEDKRLCSVHMTTRYIDEETRRLRKFKPKVKSKRLFAVEEEIRQSWANFEKIANEEFDAESGSCIVRVNEKADSHDRVLVLELPLEKNTINKRLLSLELNIKQNDFHTFSATVDDFLDRAILVKSNEKFPLICDRFYNKFYLRENRFALIIPGILARNYDQFFTTKNIRESCDLGIHRGAFVYIFDEKNSLRHRCFHEFSESAEFHKQQSTLTYTQDFLDD